MKVTPLQLKLNMPQKYPLGVEKLNNLVPFTFVSSPLDLSDWSCDY